MELSRRCLYELKERIRKETECELIPLSIKTWEFFILIATCYSIEILNLLIVTFSNFTSWTSLFALHPLNQDYFWILIFKLGLGFVFLLYLKLKYHNTKTFRLILIFWTECSIYLSINALIGSNFITESIKFLILFSFFLYFFSIDPVHLDSLKKLIYSNLSINSETGRVTRSHESRVNRTKLYYLLIALFLIFLFDMTVINAFIWVIEKLFYSGKENINELIIKNEAKNNLAKEMFAVCLIAPILEEFVFRRCLMKLGNFRWWTIPTSAFIFGISHLHHEPIQFMLPYVIPGVLYAIIYSVSRNIWITIFSHSLLNTFSFLNMIAFEELAIRH